MSLVTSKQKRARIATCIALAGISATAFALAMSMLAGVQTFAQSPAQSPPPPNQAPPSQSVPNLPKAYLPGLGEFMLTIQIHHAKLWLAAREQNWPLADYQLSEMKEVFAEVQDQVPKYKNVPVGDMIDGIVIGVIADLEKAVEQKKLKDFSAAYGKLTAACNDCHKAASRGFIQIRRPTRSTFDNEVFTPPRRR